jgi:hypothetical protein
MQEYIDWYVRRSVWPPVRLSISPLALAGYRLEGHLQLVSGKARSKNYHNVHPVGCADLLRGEFAGLTLG